MALEFSRVIRLPFAVTWSIHTHVNIKSPTRNHIILRKRQNNGAMEIRLVKKRGEASSLEKCSNHKACSPWHLQTERPGCRLSPHSKTHSARTLSTSHWGPDVPAPLFANIQLQECTISFISQKKNAHFLLAHFQKTNLTCGGKTAPRHCLRDRMTLSQQAKKTIEPLPHPYTGARRLVS